MRSKDRARASGSTSAVAKAPRPCGARARSATASSRADGTTTRCATTRIAAAITASARGPGASGGRWSFCFLRRSFMTVLDTLGRPLRDLRISVTDRCNFRCPYCMPKEVFGPHFTFLHRDELLTFEELARLARIFVRHGVEKVRLTGGEPLLRRDVERLVAQLAAIEGLDDIALTTNGSLLTREKARALKDAGLRRITISLDSLDDAVFRAMNDVDFPLARVLDAIDVAADAGLAPVKIDAVVKRG